MRRFSNNPNRYGAMAESLTARKKFNEKHLTSTTESPNGVWNTDQIPHQILIFISIICPWLDSQTAAFLCCSFSNLTAVILFTTRLNVTFLTSADPHFRTVWHVMLSKLLNSVILLPIDSLSYWWTHGIPTPLAHRATEGGRLENDRI